MFFDRFFGGFCKIFLWFIFIKKYLECIDAFKKKFGLRKKKLFSYIKFGLVFEYISGWCELSGSYQFEWWNEIIKSSYQIPYFCDKTDINRKTIGMPTVLRSHILLYYTVLQLKWDGFHLQMNWMQLSSASLNNDVSKALISTTMS